LETPYFHFSGFAFIASLILVSLLPHYDVSIPTFVDFLYRLLYGLLLSRTFEEPESDIVPGFFSGPSVNMRSDMVLNSFSRALRKLESDIVLGFSSGASVKVRSDMMLNFSSGAFEELKSAMMLGFTSGEFENSESDMMPNFWSE